MHGRQKIERSEGEELTKAKERSKKVKAYQHLMSLIFEKRSSGKLDSELNRLTSQVLMANPDIWTVWNIRRELLLNLKNSEGATFPEYVKIELDLTEACLRSNPKSYGAWHHRYWLMKETNFERVPDELKHCAKYLTFDERNFHCWDYRRYLLENDSTQSLKQELLFTTEKIVSNFSNYSSWHLRSTLLPHLSLNFLPDELQLIKNAAFTDPNDQSVWLYHRWLLISNLPQEKTELIYTHLGEEGGKIILLTVFNIPITNPNELVDVIPFNISAGEGVWSNPLNSSRSKLWILRSDGLKKSGNNVCTFHFPPYFDNETRPKALQFERTLQAELVWVKELNDIEEDNKWIISTLIMLMRLIDFRKFRVEIEECLTKVLELDPNRSNYYLDLRSKYRVEWKLAELPPDCNEVDLSNLNLTSAYYLERVCSAKSVNLSGNNLTQCKPVAALVLCEHLNLDNNNFLSSNALEFALNKLENLKNVTLVDNSLSEEVANQVKSRILKPN